MTKTKFLTHTLLVLVTWSVVSSPPGRRVADTSWWRCSGSPCHPPRSCWCSPLASHSVHRCCKSLTRPLLCFCVSHLTCRHTGCISTVSIVSLAFLWRPCPWVHFWPVWEPVPLLHCSHCKRIFSQISSCILSTQSMTTCCLPRSSSSIRRYLSEHVRSTFLS